MALEWITEKVSDDAPCGPDLDATDDPEYVDYYFDYPLPTTTVQWLSYCRVYTA